MSDLNEIFLQTHALLQRYQPPLQAKNDSDRYYDLWSYKDLIIEGRKRIELFFAGIIIQKAYVGFYFMPVYVEPGVKQHFKPELLSKLKGKSCFHIKNIDAELLSQIRDALEQGFAMYKERGWV